MRKILAVIIIAGLLVLALSVPALAAASTPPSAWGQHVAFVATGFPHDWGGYVSYIAQSKGETGMSYGQFVAEQKEIWSY